MCGQRHAAALSSQSDAGGCRQLRVDGHRWVCTWLIASEQWPGLRELENWERSGAVATLVDLGSSLRNTGVVFRAAVLILPNKSSLLCGRR